MFIFLLIPSILNRIIQSQYLIIEMLWLTLAHFHIFYFHNQSRAWSRALITDSYVQSKLCWGGHSASEIHQHPATTIYIKLGQFVDFVQTKILAECRQYRVRVHSRKFSKHKTEINFNIWILSELPRVSPPEHSSLQGCNYQE